ncbi:MAG: DNA polymerase III subunit delta [Bacteroidetes bacterium]|nr:MAG: DNA polymerase III subunit delta [Bacteroidota bacterium]
MQFRDVIGQENVKRLLRQRFNEGRMPHAMMLSGATGAGGFPLALALAQYMACSHRTEEDSCGQCPTCKKMAKIAHPDLHFCMPLIRNRESDDPATVEADMLDALRAQVADTPYFSESEWYARLGDSAKQGSISAAASRRIVEALWLKSFEIPYKFMILWLPERMHLAAANRLLKIVEEPPEGTYFILLSVRPHEVLPTIASRVQQTLLPHLEQPTIARALEDRGLAQGQVALEVAQACQGDFTEAQRIAEEGGESPFLNLMQALYRGAIANRYPDLMDWVETVAKLGREPQKEMLAYFARMVREMYMFNLGQGDLCFSIGQEREFAQKVSPYVHGRNVGWLLDEYSTTLYQIARNGNPSIIFTDMAIRHARMILLKIKV